MLQKTCEPTPEEATLAMRSFFTERELGTIYNALNSLFAVMDAEFHRAKEDANMPEREFKSKMKLVEDVEKLRNRFAGN